MPSASICTFFDGATSARHDVVLDLAPAALRMLSTSGEVLAEWPYNEIERLSAPSDILRIGRKGSDALARLEVRDPALITVIGSHASGVDPGAVIERHDRMRVVAWSLAAAVSLVLLGIFGVPQLAAQLTPLVPFAVERRLGEAVDSQMRTLLDINRSGQPFECGATGNEKAARVEFDKLVSRLEIAAALPFPLRVTVARRALVNAMALPGGHIYVFKGLIDKADTPDELAGVVGHEIGHVSHRDGTRIALESTGLSLLFGTLLGDFTGGSAVVLASRTVLKSAYSREVEAAADAYSVSLMSKAGGDPHALGAILARIGGATEPGMKILLDHPETKARVAAINAAAGSVTGAPMLTTEEWTVLKRICSGS
jgi:Zn-dependent protease with chaperone function